MQDENEEIIKEDEVDIDTDIEPTDEDISFDDESGAQGKLKKLREELKKANQEKQEYLTGWQRAKADYVNLQKENTEAFRLISIRAKEKFMEDLLPTLDAFDMAMGNSDAWQKVDANWRTGVEYIYNQLVSTLEQNGITTISQTGIPFDPNLHESVETIPTDDESKDHTIEKIIQKGYKIGERVIRPARVNIFEFKK